MSRFDRFENNTDYIPNNIIPTRQITKFTINTNLIDKTKDVWGNVKGILWNYLDTVTLGVDLRRCFYVTENDIISSVKGELPLQDTLAAFVGSYFYNIVDVKAWRLDDIVDNNVYIWTKCPFEYFSTSTLKTYTDPDMEGKKLICEIQNIRGKQILKYTFEEVNLATINITAEDAEQLFPGSYRILIYTLTLNDKNRDEILQYNLYISQGSRLALTSQKVRNRFFYLDDDGHFTISYNVIEDKPKINHKTLIGDMSLSELGITEVIVKTTAEWQLDISYKPGVGTLCVYSDYREIINTYGEVQHIPGIKIGDGNAYLVDLPFLSDYEQAELLNHIDNEEVHTTAEEKQFWNNKLNYDEVIENENFIFNRN